MDAPAIAAANLRQSLESTRLPLESPGLSRLYAADHEVHTWNPEAYK